MPQLDIRVTNADDAPRIRAITNAVGVFNTEEIDTVDELLGDYFSQGAAKSGYHFLSCHSDGEIVGFACFGPRALTRGAYDLFWIVADPTVGRQGIGGALLARVAQEVRSQGGRLVIAETSGRPDYASTRAFYLKYGYEAACTIADFYTPGDDLVIFVYRVPGSNTIR
jgi:GNAT superfamily N-acetyltransferase